MSNRVDCINKTDRQSAWERIHKLGGTVDGEGRRWSCSQEDCVSFIERGYTFYVERPVGHRVDLVVATSAHGHEYVKTRNDGEQPDNLLSLPECR